MKIVQQKLMFCAQLSIKQAFSNAMPYCQNSLKYQLLMKATTDFIVKSNQPLSRVNDKAFINLIAALDSKFVLPTRQKFTKEILPKKFEEFKETVQSQLNNPLFCHDTTDGWKSLASKSYISTTVHFINEDLFLKSIRVSLKHAPDSHSSVYLKQQLTNILEDWKIFNKTIGAVVTQPRT